MEKLFEVIVSLCICLFLFIILRKWQNFKKENKNDERGIYVVGKVSSVLFEWSFLDIIIITVAHLVIKNKLILLYAILIILAIKIVCLKLLLKKYDDMTS